MAKQPTFIGIDLGTSKVAAVVVTMDTKGLFHVIGGGMANSEGGIKQGYVNDMDKAVAALRAAKEEAMTQADVKKVEGVCVSVDSIHFKGENLRDSVTISSKDRIITDEDIERVLDQAKNNCKMAKQESVLHRIPQIYHIQGQREVRNPLNMVGESLEAEVRLILAPSSVLNNIRRVAQLAGFPKAELVYSPLATAEAILPRQDKDNSAVVIDIGEDLTHVGIFHLGTLFHSAFIAVGGRHFTRDLEIMKHLGGMVAAERIKLRYGSVIPQQVADEQIELEDEGRFISRSEIAEVLQARAVELFNFVQVEINRTGLGDFHGGIHLVGGGSILYHLPTLAQTIFGRPRVVISRPLDFTDTLPAVVNNPHFVNALGAAKYMIRERQESGHGHSSFMGNLLEAFK
ncbi:MAG: cell division protein FtsA [Holophagaceae bacterium]|jgi:cell division protein FtsA